MLYTHLVVSIASRRRVVGLRFDLEKASIILCDSEREVICDKSARTSARTCITVGAVDVDSTAWVMLEFERHLLILERFTIIAEEDDG